MKYDAIGYFKRTFTTCRRPQFTVSNRTRHIDRTQLSITTSKQRSSSLSFEHKYYYFLVDSHGLFYRNTIKSPLTHPANFEIASPNRNLMSLRKRETPPNRIIPCLLPKVVFLQMSVKYNQ